MDGWTGLGEGRLAKGASPSSCPPSREQLRSFSANHGRFGQGREPGDGGASPRYSSASVRLTLKKNDCECNRLATKYLLHTVNPF